MIQTIKADIKEAMKAKDKAKTATLRLLLAKMEKKKVELKLAKVEDLTDEQVIAVVVQADKELDKEIQAFQEVGQNTDKQEAERLVIRTYLPKQITEEEVKQLVEQAVNEAKLTAGNVGDVMKKLSQLRGKTDMKRLSELVRSYF
ncbi:hypothetical protein PQE66_gp173 [Bacillus phage PBC2]|uniref:GatB/YqeY domain-containing protein n=1 Tax=Bacillus phage PBC2 TaxID=1675029 RepID=A0A218KC79_9CAUD|nr:hypothetical protein PQE66_gp173 [Bacillus phage PBC2]AKQ08488.1 hypothetical protein PBC2_173 [Bacillus phage PBC2]